jgi:hypothetical protein
MNENQAKESSLVDTTDCLEAVGVFRGWKNFLFVISICSLVMLQVSFLLVKFGYIEPAGDAAAAKAEGPEQIKKAAEKVTIDPNQPIKLAPKPEKSSFFGMTFNRLSWLIRFFNFVLILTAVLYCLTMLFSLKVSLLGRLGGINHIARAFFLSLTFAVLLMPWQSIFPGMVVVVGAMYTPAELQSACAKADEYNIFATILHYLRFTGYWLLVLLLLIFAHLRGSLWAKAILRRLEVI